MKQIFVEVCLGYGLTLLYAPGGMLFGFDISSMSAIIGTKQYINYFNNPSGAYQGAIGSALAAGSTVGCVIVGPISDKIGRRDATWFGEPGHPQTSAPGLANSGPKLVFGGYSEPPYRCPPRLVASSSQEE